MNTRVHPAHLVRGRHDRRQLMPTKRVGVDKLSLRGRLRLSKAVLQPNVPLHVHVGISHRVLQSLCVRVVEHWLHHVRLKTHLVAVVHAHAAVVGHGVGQTTHWQAGLLLVRVILVTGRIVEHLCLVRGREARGAWVQSRGRARRIDLLRLGLSFALGSGGRGRRGDI